jgi:N-acetylmuramate 1-kinase
MAVQHMIPPESAPQFLADAGWAGAAISPLAGDASFRRYFRVDDAAGGRRAVLMDAPAPHEDPRPFIAMVEYLCRNGFRAPAILASDLGLGLVLIEDFGDRLMRAEVAQSPQREHDIYSAAVDILVDLAACAPAEARPYDMAEYIREVRLFTEWAMPALGMTDVDTDAYAAIWQDVLQPVIDAGLTTTVLRDYHAENIMLIGADGSRDVLGLLDFQDALVGHPAYDLVSLLQDARREVAPELEQAMLAHYCGRTGAGEDFLACYALLGAQRNTKIIGIFTRLAYRDGKARYLDLIPRMWALLERDLAHPALAPVARWFDDHVPPAMRIAPPAPAAAAAD